ncbi:hypothetical protein M153_35600001125, partial [Pseudoloma neurophilia]
MILSLIYFHIMTPIHSQMCHSEKQKSSESLQNIEEKGKNLIEKSSDEKGKPFTQQSSEEKGKHLIQQSSDEKGKNFTQISSEEKGKPFTQQSSEEKVKHFTQHSSEEKVKHLQSVLKKSSDDSFLQDHLDVSQYYTEKGVLNLSKHINIFIPYSKINLLPSLSTVKQLFDIESKIPNILDITGLPDLHHGYCFSIGSVISTNNVVVPEGIGSDINCGVRMIKCDVQCDDIQLDKILKEIYDVLPVGIGNETANGIIKEIVSEINSRNDRKGSVGNDEKGNGEKGFVGNDKKRSVGNDDTRIMTEKSFLNGILDEGLDFLVKHNVIPDYREFVESHGHFPADSRTISQKAKSKGLVQLGSLGAGNHFLEFQRVETV